MGRAAWLREKGRLAEERMDTLFAPEYDEQLPAGGIVLDMKWRSLLLMAPRRVERVTEE